MFVPVLRQIRDRLFDNLDKNGAAATRYCDLPENPSCRKLTLDVPLASNKGRKSAALGQNLQKIKTRFFVRLHLINRARNMSARRTASWPEL